MTSKRILIIDDDLELCEELKEALDEYDVTFSLDPFKGETLLRNENYDVVLLDYKMPGLTGVDIIKKLKSDNIQKNIIIITGRPFVDKELEEKGLSGMVKGIITKPINFDVLIEKINS